MLSYYDYSIRSISNGLCILLSVILFLIIADISYGKTQSSIVIDNSLAHRSWIVYEYKIAPPLNISALSDASGKYLVGWVEYDFNVSETGWYKFNVPVTNNYASVRYIFDDKMQDRPLAPNNDWIWLDAGAHILRAEDYFWTGFPNITSLRLEKANEEDGPGFRLLRPGVSSFRSDECPEVTLIVGGDSKSYELIGRISSRDKNLVETIKVKATDTPYATTFRLQCTPGDHDVLLSRVGLGRVPLTQRFNYTVFGVDKVDPKFIRGSLVQEIDLAKIEPNFTSGPTYVEESKAGLYRVSDRYGFTEFERSPKPRRDDAHRPSWFAYELTLTDISRPFILEIDYPDDANRASVVAIRSNDDPPFSFPVSIALETGIIWPLSGKMASRDVMFWASDVHPRVVIMNVHNGTLAAAAKIRVYAADEFEKPVLESPKRSEKRDFVFWYEEGENFDHLVNVHAGTGHSYNLVDRWLREMKFFGASTIIPTVAIYNFAFYPSLFNLAFSHPDHDLLRAILLDAERFDLKVRPQLAPRADEILWNVGETTSRRTHMLLSRDGQRKFVKADGSIEIPPYYNALDPYIQDWYVGMVGELADRYKDFPAFDGIDLRVTSWANTALNNLVSLDWGYDQATIARFAKESGIDIPGELIAGGKDDSEMAPRRYNFIIKNCRQKWIDWRCRKIFELYMRLRDRIRAANPRFKLSVSIFSTTSDVPDHEVAPNDLTEAGIDLSLLRELDGVAIINATGYYGRRETAETWQRRSHAYLMKQQSFSSFASKFERPNILISMANIEAVPEIVPQASLGLHSMSSEPWSSSAASNPPGRLYLERFATVLGQTDAVMLGDGGNGYVFSSTTMKEFQEQFRLLPAVPFNRLDRASDMIALWQKGDIFYLINMTPFPVRTTLGVRSQTKISRADGSGSIDTQDKRALVLLHPFELLVFQTTQEDAILSAKASLQQSDMRRLQISVETLEQRKNDLCREAAHQNCEYLSEIVKREKDALSQNAIWTLLRLIEETDGQQILAQTAPSSRR